MVTIFSTMDSRTGTGGELKSVEGLQAEIIVGHTDEKKRKNPAAHTSSSVVLVQNVCLDHNSEAEPKSVTQTFGAV